MMPAALMLQFARLFNAYDRTLNEDVVNDAAACGTGDCLSNSYFYYKPYYWDDSSYAATPYQSVFVLTNEYHRQFLFVVAAIFSSVAVAYWTLPAFEEEYNMAVEAQSWEAEKEM